MRYRLLAIALAALVACTVAAAQADDAGTLYGLQPIRTAARILLSAEARDAGVAPSDIAIQDVVASGNDAILSYEIGSKIGLIALVRTKHGWTLRLRAAQAGSEDWFMEAYSPLHWP